MPAALAPLGQGRSKLGRPRLWPRFLAPLVFAFALPQPFRLTVDDYIRAYLTVEPLLPINDQWAGESQFWNARLARYAASGVFLAPRSWSICHLRSPCYTWTICNSKVSVLVAFRNEISQRENVFLPLSVSNN